jgi:ribosome biogenesis GTPase / thiamine phosphate phosphatase
MVEGTVLRSHAGGCVVHLNELGIDFQCASRGRLKKENISIFAGDRVELDEVNTEQATAVISARLDRSNLLSRPPLANVDQVFIVQAIHQPEWNPLWCDRHLIHFQLEIPTAAFVLCFNKCDLARPEEISVLRSIYEPLGYVVTIVSAKTGEGVSELGDLLSGKITVLAGPSGVGKSSLINFLNPKLNLKVGIMENEFGVGRHTTTASELYRLLRTNSELPAWVADTPGFSLSELRHADPADLSARFPELARFSPECRFSNCLHIVEHDCNVLANLNKIAPERYQSYLALIQEAQNEQKLRQEVSTKVEANVKSVGGKLGAKQIPRLSNRYRAPSRRTEKQQLSATSIDDIDQEDED